MKHFKEEGPLFKSVAAGAGTSMRKALLAGVGIFGMVSLAVMVFVLKASEADPAVYAVVPLFILSLAVSIMVLGRTMGSGCITVDTATGMVSVRNASFYGFGGTKLQRSDIEELVLQEHTFETGSGTRHRVMLHTSRGDLLPTGFSFTDADTAREAGTELASLLSVNLRVK